MLTTVSSEAILRQETIDNGRKIQDTNQETEVREHFE